VAVAPLSLVGEGICVDAGWVKVGTEVVVAVGSSVACRVAVGVQVGGRPTGGVGVIVGVISAGDSVGGGNGLNIICGLIKIAANPIQVHTVVSTITTVAILKIIPALSLLG
jgi:hypothetical protein